MRKRAYWGFALVVMVGLSAPAFAQTPDGDEYRVIYAETDPVKKADLSEKFLANPAASHADSQYREGVVYSMVMSYMQTKNWPKVLATADRLNQLLPKGTVQFKKQVYQQALDVAFTTLKDLNKGLQVTDLMLALDPNELNSLIIQANNIVENLPTDVVPREAALNKVVNAARKVLATPRPADKLTEAQWLPIPAQMHAVLGYAHYLRKDFAGSIKEYEESLKVSPKEEKNWYRMGLAHEAGPVNAASALVVENQKKDTEMFESIKALGLNLALPAHKAQFDELQPKLLEIRKQGDELDAALDQTLDKAIHAYVSAVAIGGTLADPAQKRLESAYKNRFTTLEGLHDLIAKRKAELK